MKDVTPLYWSRTATPTPSPTSAASQPLPPSSGHLYADIDSTIRIHIDRQALADKELYSRDGEFFASGRLSLAARIGDRQVEVQGYSEVGKGRTPVGPPGDVSPLHFLLNLKYFQYRLFELVHGYDGIQPALDAEKLTRGSQPSDIKAARRKIAASLPSKVSVLADILTLLTADPATATAFFKVSQSSPAFVKASLKDLRDLLPRSPGSPSTPIPSPTPAPDTTTALLEVQSAAYQADASAYRLLENAKRADRLYEVSAGALEKEADASKRPQLQTAADQARAQRDKAWDDYVKQRTKADSLKATANTLAEAPSQEERLLDLLLGLDTELNRDLYAYSKQYKNDVVSREIVDEYWRDPVWSTTDASGARVHSRQVGAFFEVYRKLVDAQIVPNRIGAKPGDVIIVDLLVYPESQPSTAAAPGSPESNADKFVAFTVAEVHVFSFGWRVAVADSFLLIKRLEEGNAADPNHVPNNYRPAPGASLTWSEIPRPESTECFISCWVARNIAPSYGFNVSFVNFDKTKTFEIGLGGVIGLFRDQIQVGAGVNLSGDGSFKNRSYFFIGLSFARLAEKLGGPMHIGTLGEKPSP